VLIYFLLSSEKVDNGACCLFEDDDGFADGKYNLLDFFLGDGFLASDCGCWGSVIGCWSSFSVVSLQPGKCKSK
jgi:hypothetical protein